MRALYFGTYEQDYPRNAQVISCLRTAGVEVVERHVGLWEGRRHKWSLGPSAALRAGAAELRLATRGRAGDADVLIVGYPGHLDMPLARLVAGGRPLVFNPLVSLWDTLADDRGSLRSASLAGRAVRRLDRLAFRSADLVVADTDAHAAFFSERFGLEAERVDVCFVGAEDRLFVPPAEKPSDRPFQVLFVGKLIPLHGLETILGAAERAPELPFRIVGSGQLQDVLTRRPANVEWVPWVEYERLPAEIHAAGCVLGIFGTSAKAARVIPNKAFQALACGAPLVTADTPAVRELLVDGESAALVPAGDAGALADAVRRLAADRALAERLGAGGLAAYRAQASEQVLGARWRRLLEPLVVR